MKPTSRFSTAGLLLPVQVVPPSVEQLLCSSGANIAQLVGLALALASVYFIAMFVIRMAFEVDKHGGVPPGRSPELNTLKKGRHSRLAAQDGMFYLAGATGCDGDQRPGVSVPNTLNRLTI